MCIASLVSEREHYQPSHWLIYLYRDRESEKKRGAEKSQGDLIINGPYTLKQAVATLKYSRFLIVPPCRRPFSSE